MTTTVRLLARRARLLASGLTLLSLGVLGYALGHLEILFIDPGSIRRWFVLPIAGAILFGGLRLLPTPGRLALTALALSILGIELAFGLASTRSRPKVETGTHPEYYTGDADLGWAGKRDFRSRAWKQVDGRRVYDVHYTIDPLGRRFTPLATSERRTRFLLFFGGSFMFGEGVEDAETLPYFVAQRAPRHMPYNYGFHGYGPQQLIAKLEAGALRDEVAGDRGTLIYLFVDGHVKRAIGSMIVYAGWAHSAPHYESGRDGRLARRGTLTDGRPGRALLYSLLGPSQALRFWNIDIPPVNTDRHVRVAATMLTHAAERYWQIFGPERFVVVIFPGSSHGESLAAHLAGTGIETLDYRDLLDYTQAEHFIAEDWHPSAKTHQVLAARLARDLGLEGSDTRGR